MASCQEVNTPFGVFCHVVVHPVEEEGKDAKVATTNKTPPHIIIVMDKSGSMSGPRIKNAKDAVIQLIQSVKETCSTTVVSFESYASVCRDGKNVVKYVEGLTAGGGTCFKNAFDQVVKCMDTTGDTIIVLVTDGETDDEDVTKSIDVLCSKINKVKGVVQCHSLGISNEATITLLQKLAEAGSVTGTVQHVSNAGRIKECLETLIDIILHEKIISVTTTEGVKVVNEVLKGSMPEGILVNRVPVAVVRLPPTDLYLLSPVDSDKCFKVLLSAIQSIAREIQDNPNHEDIEKKCKTASELIQSLNLLDSQKTHLSETVDEVKAALSIEIQCMGEESVEEEMHVPRLPFGAKGKFAVRSRGVTAQSESRREVNRLLANVVYQARRPGQQQQQQDQQKSTD